MLQKNLDELSCKKNDMNQTIGYYEKQYPIEFNKIKKELIMYIPIGKNFQKLWKAACQSITQDRSLKKLGKKS